MFIHDAVLEILTCGDTQTDVCNLRLVTQKMGEADPTTELNEFETQFKVYTHTHTHSRYIRLSLPPINTYTHTDTNTHSHTHTHTHTHQQTHTPYVYLCIFWPTTYMQILEKVSAKPGEIARNEALSNPTKNHSDDYLPGIYISPYHYSSLAFVLCVKHSQVMTGVLCCGVIYRTTSTLCLPM